MADTITIEDVDRSLATRDRELWSMIVQVAAQSDPTPDVPVRDGASTITTVYRRHRSLAFHQQDAEVQRQERLRDWARLEADDAEVPPPPRWWLFRILDELWAEGTPWARDQLVQVLLRIPLRYGPWRAVKRIFKEAEAKGDWEIYGAITARLDMAYTDWRMAGEVSRSTLRYLVRRAWRTLRRVGERMPSAYPDRCSDVLRHYGKDTPMYRTWVANHILFHHLPLAYNRNRFVNTGWHGRKKLDFSNRAFPAAWRRTPRPLFDLLERARADAIRSFAVAVLKSDFRTQLRDVEVAWVVRLVRARSQVVDDFVAWLLDNVPRFEPTAFRTLGLHDSVVDLLDSESAAAAEWAARYARTHARDLPLPTLTRLANGPHDTVRALSRDLLRDRDARTEVGLAVWGELLGTPHAHDLAVEAIREHFGPAELTLDWFRQRMVSDAPLVVTFAFEHIGRTHPPARVPMTFWASVLDDERVNASSVRGLEEVLAERPVAEMGADVLRRALLNSATRPFVRGLANAGRLEPRMLGVQLLKDLVHRSAWEASATRRELRASGRPWAEELAFDEELASFALRQLDDPRAFTVAEIGVDWLLGLEQAEEHVFLSFALPTLVGRVAPADLAADPEAPGAAMAGAERVFEWLVAEGPSDDPQRQLAVAYLENHHPVLFEARSGKPLDPAMHLPDGFVTLRRASRLFGDERRPVREIGIRFMKADLVALGARLPDLVGWAELPHADVFEFVTEALTAPDKEEFRRYRIDPATFEGDDVYRLCDSLDPAARGLGMTLIAKQARLAVPTELFRLTESPDRKVVAFVVRQLWSLYRHRAVSDAYEPPVDAEAAGVSDAPPVPDDGADGAFADPGDIRAFLRRTLFTIPPARPEKARAATKGEAPAGSRPVLRRVPAREAKLALIEVCRDLAIEDRAFARRVVPVFQEFLKSQGKSESAACLVALTRIRHRWRDGGRAPRGDR